MVRRQRRTEADSITAGEKQILQNSNNVERQGQKTINFAQLFYGKMKKLAVDDPEDSNSSSSDSIKSGSSMSLCSLHESWRSSKWGISSLTSVKGSHYFKINNGHWRKTNIGYHSLTSCFAVGIYLDFKNICWAISFESGKNVVGEHWVLMDLVCIYRFLLLYQRYDWICANEFFIFPIFTLNGLLQQILYQLIFFEELRFFS